MPRLLRSLGLTGSLFAMAYGCGARSSLEVPRARGTTGEGGSIGDGGAGGAGGAGGFIGAGGVGGAGGAGGAGGGPSCDEGTARSCGVDEGECALGKELCTNGQWGPCSGAIEPADELCNGLDDDCDGQTDEGFKLGAACDGPDTDFCADDVITCAGCSPGPDAVETCNGKDDNCNGTIDSDCDTGGCKPALLVTGSTPSNINCVDFPVEKGATGVIQYPCSGGNVSAKLGSLSFSGNVVGGVVTLSATGSYLGPDGCTWQTQHSITGTLPDGVLTYFYSEAPIAGMNCWFACTETGTVQVNW